MPIAVKLISNIRRLMADRQITQAYLAKESNIVTTQLNNYLTGRNTPGLEPLEKIARALGVSVASLLGDEVPSPLPRSLSLEEMKLTAISAILAISDEATLKTILDLFKPRLNSTPKQNKRGAS